MKEKSIMKQTSIPSFKVDGKYWKMNVQLKLKV